jgi:hypothetical protein
MKFKITIRSDDIELRGYIKSKDDLHASELVHLMGETMQDFGALVIASPVDDNYNPFAMEEL